MDQADVICQSLEVQEEEVSVTPSESESHVKKEEQQSIQPPEEASHQTPGSLPSISTAPEHENMDHQPPGSLPSISTAPEHEKMDHQPPGSLPSISTAPEHENMDHQTPGSLPSISTALEDEMDHPSAEPEAHNQEKPLQTSSSNTGKEHEDRADEDPQVTEQLSSGPGEVKKEEQQSIQPPEEASHETPGSLPSISTAPEHENMDHQTPGSLPSISTAPEHENMDHQTPGSLPSISTAPEHENMDHQTPGSLPSISTAPEHENMDHQTPGSLHSISTALEDEMDHPSAEPEAEKEKSLQTSSSSGTTLMLVGVLGLLLAVLVSSLFSQSPAEQAPVPRVDIFLRELERTRARFPGQRADVWRRSRIHLEKHLRTAQPTEPVSLILTAGRGAERTLRCLARQLASAFSSALNGSALHIDGASKAGQDSDRVKLDIDGQLRRAFEGDQPVAVIHRFEELPPSSAIIFYRYCDHENAAYKQASLIFTVLLSGEEELSGRLGLSAVEEMVDDHLQARFLSTAGHPAAFDRMDLDKFSGLWSRISHLILPVAAEDRIEQQGCAGI